MNLTGVSTDGLPSRRAILTPGKAPYRLVILKRRFPVTSGKTIVRKLLKYTVLTIIDSHAFKDDS